MDTAMTRTDILNHLIKEYGFKSYLEVGVNIEADNFDHIKCQYRIGVDPNGVTSFTGTSDEFFANNQLRFDLIFIDGLHTEDQVTRDINNSLRVLREGGMIVTHDSLPISEDHQRDVYGGRGIWAGGVWKSLALIRSTRPDVKIDIVDTDWGCGILRFGVSDPYPVTKLDWTFYCTHRETMFNIISPQKFLFTYRSPK